MNFKQIFKDVIKMFSGDNQQPEANFFQFRELFAPTMEGNIILKSDSYKASHPELFPKNVRKATWYIECRVKNRQTVMAGISLFSQLLAAATVTPEMVDEAEDFYKRQGTSFNRSIWDKIVSECNGKIPLTISSVPEGTVLPSSNCLVKVSSEDLDAGDMICTLGGWIETILQRAVWYPTTIASNCLEAKQILREYCEKSVDPIDGEYPGIKFMLHEFAMRGVTCEEQAALGGAAHQLFFMGSDNNEATRFVERFFGIREDNPFKISAVSVNATEHTVQLLYGESKDQQEEYVKAYVNMNVGKPASIVLDGFDLERELDTLCGYAQTIKENNSIAVARPDSGDPVELAPKCLDTMAKAFGFTVNTKGYKVLQNARLIWGDGIDNNSMRAILDAVLAAGYSAENMIFGSGGGLLQKVNRDTFSIAQKICYAEYGQEDGSVVGVPLRKAPKTDMSKASKAGNLVTVRSIETGEIFTTTIDKLNADNTLESIMQVYYRYDRKTKMVEVAPVEKFDVIRDRANGANGF